MELINEFGESRIFRALYLRQVWGGVPRTLFLINLFVGLFAGIILKLWFVVGITIVLHFLFRFFAQKDADFFDVFIGNLTNRNYYDAY